MESVSYLPWKASRGLSYAGCWEASICGGRLSRSPGDFGDAGCASRPTGILLMSCDSPRPEGLQGHAWGLTGSPASFPGRNARTLPPVEGDHGEGGEGGSWQSQQDMGWELETHCHGHDALCPNHPLRLVGGGGTVCRFPPIGPTTDAQNIFAE